MDFNNWYALSINMNKENSTKSELLARRAVFQDTYLEEVDYLKRKEIVIEKSGKRTVKNKLLMSGYLLVKVKPMEVEDDEEKRADDERGKSQSSDSSQVAAPRRGRRRGPGRALPKHSTIEEDEREHKQSSDVSMKAESDQDKDSDQERGKRRIGRQGSAQADYSGSERSDDSSERAPRSRRNPATTRTAAGPQRHKSARLAQKSRGAVTQRTSRSRTGTR